MKIVFSTLFTVLFFSSVFAQERFLIKETDSLLLYETYLSNSSISNVFPSIYNNGLLYVSSDNSSNTNKLYFSDLKSKPKKIAIGSKFHFGSAAENNGFLYFTGISKKKSKKGTYNAAIYKAEFNNLKVSKATPLPFCDPNFSYTDPSFSKDGKKMIVVSNERNVFHIVEYILNEKDRWIKKGVVYITHPDFDIINPTYFNDNTIYFSSNTYKGAIEGVSYTTNKTGEIVVDKVHREQGSFNIYKTTKKDGHWTIPIKVPALNSEFDELGVIFDSEKSGYLTSFRFNSNDNIYYFELKY